MKIDLLLKNAKVFNSYLKKFFEANVAILDGKVLFIDKNKNQEFDAKEIFDCDGKYLIPGLIDIHMHIESSMTTPEIFASQVRKFGVTTIVEEPHEIANVAGMDGILEFIGSKEECLL
ncbi:MAG: amidohydrolase family protein [Sarcina sp.]